MHFNRTFEQKSTVKYMHKSHMHPNHFQTVEKIVFLTVKNVFFTSNLVTNGNIRHLDDSIIPQGWYNMQDDYLPFVLMYFMEFKTILYLSFPF